jgi:hypothetical protein
MKNLFLITSALVLVILYSCECGEKAHSGTIPSHSDDYEELLANIDKSTCELSGIKITFERDVSEFSLHSPTGCDFVYPATSGTGEFAVHHSGTVFSRISEGTYTVENVTHRMTSDGKTFTSTDCPVAEGDHQGAWKLIIKGSSSSELDYSLNFLYD